MRHRSRLAAVAVLAVSSALGMSAVMTTSRLVDNDALCLDPHLGGAAL